MKKCATVLEVYSFEGIDLFGYFADNKQKIQSLQGFFLPNLESVENACRYDLITSADVKDTASYSW